MQELRRDFLKKAGLTVAGATSVLAHGANAVAHPFTAPIQGGPQLYFDVRTYGAKGDGTTVDSPAINAAIDAAASQGGGTVVFPPGVYASYSIHLKSFVNMFLQPGATILAAPTPYEGTTSGGYDAAEPQGSWEPFQDYGHNHWHNSLLWGENIHDFGIFGTGLIWGKGLSRGHNEKTLPDTTAPGVANKAIALKNCHNVVLRDFSILQGGWFAVLATGVDNFTIDNLKIDTNRDGIDLDCCRNARVSSCSVNSPWDDAICPKSSFALGYARTTENITISDCYLTGDYEVGTLLDGTWKPMKMGERRSGTGRIKCGTESNGGFKNIAISNCLFDGCRGFALESVDGALCEDITFTGITMRNVRTSPVFMRLGARLRGPKPETQIGSLKRIIISDVTSYNCDPLPSIIAGVPGHPVEDVKISNVYLHQLGGVKESSFIDPPENADKYPEPTMFGELPATGLFVRHAKNLEVSNLEVAVETADTRPAFWLNDVEGADFFRVKMPGRASSGQFRLHDVHDLRVFGCPHYPDSRLENAENSSI